jgi:hypothetical protein
MKNCKDCNYMSGEKFDASTDIAITEYYDLIGNIILVRHDFGRVRYED